MERIHGGDWAGFLAERGWLPLDFSANTSPLGVPEGVRQAISDAAGKADRYPDPLCRELTAALAEREDVPPEQVLCGAGAADLIYRAVQAARPRLAVVTAPSFGEYEAALETVSASVTRVLLSPADFRPDRRLLDAVSGADMAVLCQPGNPAGVTVPRPFLLELLERCRETGCRLMADECFLDFLEEPDRHTLKSALDAAPNLLIIRAFTKFYGLAGVRLGYALCADTAFLDAMRRAGPPWAVSNLAQAAGLAALRETEYAENLRTLIAAERPRLHAGLVGLGMRVVPGEANFLLFLSPAPLDEPLRERGILIRNCGDFAGLDRSWYRVSVRTREENDRLLTALGEVLA